MGAKVTCFVDLGLIFLEEWLKVGRCLFEYLRPGGGDALEDVNRV